MKTSLRHALATAGLACVLTVPALAATATAATVSDIPAGIGQQPMTPGGSALPPGTGSGDTRGSNGTDGSNVRPETRMTPDGRQNLEKKPVIERQTPQPRPARTPGDEPRKDTPRESQ
ncbi:hypothetical protein IFR09_01600 [Pseudomonas syringae]|nr:hypothetical protein [Pseudomonas syringae]MBD8573017.1 hypothetical protein [Pseudomonas syringae]MBD8790472.1 hypothetical protein [Pseudomonas syringae]MBD8799030.1 hypothetical protein [Pseudomonas syringae]MBD8809856.1 hypothetical protein [Pseudomonas syringae]